MSPGAAILAFAVSGVAGLVSGVFPAYQATRVNPIDALRFE
jgi:ABC-type antimicrobial peptide transport system permease subunit